MAGLGTATDLGLGLPEFLFSRSSTFFTAAESVEFFRTGFSRGGELLTGGEESSGLEAKVTEWFPAVWPGWEGEVSSD